MNRQGEAAGHPFWLGCNYWASHAGTAMWSDWRPETVEQDLDNLAATGVSTLRVFPLWPDFQPITRLRKYAGESYEIRMGEEPLPHDEIGQAGLSPVMLERFAAFMDMAEARGLRLIPALITGWMSGRLFVPHALEGRNLIGDAEAVLWQVRFVRAFVRRFRESETIIAWGLGNECNCLAEAGSRSEAWRWTAQIADAIRSEDATRPILSDMHSLSASRTGLWTIEDQAESTDLLTIHPYPQFTPHCNRDPLNTMRSCLHATTESVLYADIGGKPCLAEEVGTLGPTFGSEQVAGDYLRTILYSLWAHGDRGMLWWCGFDQGHLPNAPYDWIALERELGILGSDYRAKPVAKELKAFSEFLKSVPVLPERRRDAICILTDNQDNWGAAYASMILAKQAGFELRFQTASQALAESELYLMPSVRFQPTRRFCRELKERVRQGATLYVSLDDAVWSDIQEWFGFEVEVRQQRASVAQVDFEGKRFEVAAPFRWRIQPAGCEVLAAEPDGNPAFTRVRMGEGAVYFLSIPLETALVQQPGVFHEPDALPVHRFYRQLATNVRAGRIVSIDLPALGITEHPFDDGRCIVVIINYSPEPVRAAMEIGLGWRLDRVIRGVDMGGGTLPVAANDAAVIELRRG